MSKHFLPKLSHIKDYIAYVCVRIFICIIQTLRLETCQRISAMLAVVANDLFKVRRDVIESNLEIAFPQYSMKQRRDVSRKMWEHLFLMIAEIAHTPRKLHATNWRKHIHFKNMQHTTWLLLQRRAMVIVCGHYGNFELSGYVMGMLGFATFTVARTLDNLFIDRYLNRFRSATGQYLLPKQGSYETAERMLSLGGKLTILGDQHAGPKGYWIEFFGKLTSTHKAISIFSLTNDAKLSVGYSRRLQKPLDYEIGFQAVADPLSDDPIVSGSRKLTNWHCQKLEEIIRDDPTQYWWIHRRWRGEVPAIHLRRLEKLKKRNAA